MRIAVAAGAATDEAGNDSVAAEVVTDYVDESAIRTRTMAIMRNFMVARADQIVAAEPDIAGRLRARQSRPARLTGNAEDDRANLSASGSIEKGALGFWAEGSYVSVSTDRADTKMMIGHAGVDWQLADNMIAGFMVEVDSAEQDEDGDGFAVEGTGWMVGPYIAADIRSGIVLDARFAWGKSDNEITPYDTYTDNVEADRRLLKVGLSGQYEVTPHWRVTPGIDVLHFIEESDAYTDSQQVDIYEQEVSVGRVTFGPVMEGRYGEAGDMRFTPRISLKGLWDFDTTDEVRIETGEVLSGSKEFRARMSAGFAVQAPGGGRFTADGFYDGIGSDDVEAFGLTFGYRLPLN